MLELRVIAARRNRLLTDPVGSLGCALLAPLALASACAPSAYSLHVRSAERAQEAARARAAEQHAPYEWVQAQLYLEKAREEAGEAHYALALELLAHAEQSAALAAALSPGTGRAVERSGGAR